MDYKELKEELHQLIDEVNDEDLLYRIRSVIEESSAEEHDWADDLSDEMRESLERGIADADAGRVVSHEEVIKMFKEKYGRP